MKYLRPRDAADRLGVGLTTFWRLVKEDKRFPRPLKLGARTTVIVEGELADYMAQMAADRPPVRPSVPAPVRPAAEALAA